MRSAVFQVFQGNGFWMSLRFGEGIRIYQIFRAMPLKSGIPLAGFYVEFWLFRKVR